MIDNNYRWAKSVRLKVSGFVMLFMIMSVLITGCDENNNQNESLRAVLSVRESPNVPGRMEFDPRGSKPGVGQKLESHTLEVIDQETGETVFGPVTESATSDGALKKAHFPSGDYLAILTVSATTIMPDGDTDVRGPEGNITDTTDETFSVDAVIAFPEADSCQATCSQSKTNTAHTICALSTKCFMADLEEDVLSQAQGIDPSINFNTTMWIHAYGASGGDGTSPDLGGDGGKAGAGGFAQTITSLNALDFPFIPATIYYYIGEAGEHDDSGGTGGASTIVTTVEPQSGNSIALDTILLIAGGGGGGGEGGDFDEDGSDGGGGGFANSTAVGVSDTDKGDDGKTKGGLVEPGLGGGGTSCSEGIACGGDGQSDDKTEHNGKQGFGGESGGSDEEDPGPRKWINETPDIGDAGKGGDGISTGACSGGGGGGGYGGGGAGGRGADLACGGGGGGGSYAAGSTTTDKDATSTNPKHSGDGEVHIIFNTDPSM